MLEINVNFSLPKRLIRRVENLYLVLDIFSYSAINHTPVITRPITALILFFNRMPH